MHISVAENRTLRPLPGIVIHRSAHLDARVDWQGRPPRVRPTEATLDVVQQRVRNGDVASAYAALTRACFTREVVPHRLRTALEARQRVTQRSLIMDMISDVESGACSMLERGYLQRVERAHALPRGNRQGRSEATGRRTYRDVHYRQFNVIVEPDGKAFHDSPEARDNDALRDLAECASSDVLTLRVTYGLVFGDSCRTARWIAAVLQRRGWRGEFQRCPQCP